MATFPHYPRGWTITCWTGGPPMMESGGIPEHSFQQQSIMLIGLDSTASGTYGLVWLNQSGVLCSVEGLRLDSKALTPTLTGTVRVSFGPSEVKCSLHLTLKLSETGQPILTGWLHVVDMKGRVGRFCQANTGSGTFTAEANAGPPALVEAGAAREHIAYLGSL